MSEYFPGQKSIKGKMKVELNLCNYETKADLKTAIGAATSKLLKTLM